MTSWSGFDRIAGQYRTECHSVLVDPAPDELTEFLCSYRVDILAGNVTESAKGCPHGMAFLAGASDCHPARRHRTHASRKALKARHNT